MYAYICGKPVKGKDFIRYWASISTEILAKDGSGTGDYYTANIDVRMSKKAEDVFDEFAERTKNKDISGAFFDLEDFWLKAGKPYEDDDGNESQRLILFINKMDIVEKKSKRKGKKPSED